MIDQLSPAMRMAAPVMVAISIALFVLWCEWIHARRSQRVAHLAFGPGGKPRPWTRAVPFFRALSVSLMVWALCFILLHDGERDASSDQNGELSPDETEYVSLILDFSPSMLLQDGGDKGEITRKDRMKVVVESLLGRFGEHVRFNLVCFYTKPMPMVEDAFDKNIVYNVLNDLPIERVMGPGKTDLGKAINKGLEIIENKPKGSTTVILVTDGDTVEMEELNYLPASVRSSLVLGVGNTKVGMSIDGQMSRQEPENLKYVANHLKGTYMDVNTSLVPGTEIHHLIQADKSGKSRSWDLVDIALLVFILNALLYGILPIAQEVLGSSWRTVQPGRSRRSVS